MVSCEPHEILLTVNIIHFRHINGLLTLVIDHIAQFFCGIQSVSELGIIVHYPNKSSNVISLCTTPECEF